MYTPPRVARLFLVYTTFVAGTCAACHSLLTATASNIVLAPQVVTDNGQASYSRVEGWLKRQSIVNLKKPTATAAARMSSNTYSGTMTSAPEHEIARALVLAAAIDNAEHNQVTPQTSPQSGLADGRQLRARPVHRRVRVPSCQVLPCHSAHLKPVVTLRGNFKPLLASARPVKLASAKPVKKVLQRTAKAALKLQKPAANSKVAAQLRLKSDRRIALQRFRETPAEISYRSFVGTFVPAT